MGVECAVDTIKNQQSVVQSEQPAPVGVADFDLSFCYETSGYEVRRQPISKCNELPFGITFQ